MERGKSGQKGTTSYKYPRYTQFAQKKTQPAEHYIPHINVHGNPRSKLFPNEYYLPKAVHPSCV